MNNKVKENTLEDTKLAYIAGIVDGEGCISVRKRGIHGSLPLISVVNTNWEVLKLIKDTFGGSISIHNRPKTEASKWCYIWRQSCLPAAETLERLLPYLIVKKKHALLAIQLTTCNSKEALQITQEISKLNRRGRGGVEE